MKNVLVYDCTIYLDAEKDENLNEAANRLERILKTEGLDYQCYNLELLDEEGEIVESK